MKSTILSFFTLAVLLFAIPESRAVDYKEEIRPILNKKCYQCHSGPRAKGKLRMDSDTTFADRIGGDDPVIVPGNPTTSLLVIKASLPRTDGEAMPPPPARARGAEPLTGVELNTIREWIMQGAKLDASAPDPEPAGEPAMTDAAPEIHDWTNTSNVTIKAMFLAVKGTDISLKTAAGQVYTFPLDRLSPESQALAKRLAAN
ncbi:MAG: c-type cytochrome domain-containing protein [Verrucomicrobiota bacterium]